MGTPLAGIDADVVATVTPSISASNEACSNTDSGAWKVWQVTNTARRYWDDATPVVVQDSSDGSTGWATVSSSSYTFQYCGGIITFPTAHGKHYIRILSGNYFNVASIADCTDWALDMSGQTEDTTVFQSTGGWASVTPSFKQAAVKISSFVHDDTFFKLLGNRLIVILYADKSAGTRWEGYASCTGVKPKTTATKLFTQEADFTYEAVYYYLS